MRTLLVFFAISLLSLLCVNVAHAASGEVSNNQEQSTQDACYTSPICDDPWTKANCAYCQKQTSSVWSSTRITIETPYGPIEGDDWDIAAAAQVQALVDELVLEFPEPSLERDRALAKIFGDNGFLLPQAEILMRVVDNSGFNVNPEDVATIQRNYNAVGWEDISVEYGNWIDAQLSAYEVDIPVLPPIYIDPYVNLRSQVFANNAEAYTRLNDSANAAATQQAIEALEQQQELSLLPNMVVIVRGQ